MLTTKEAQIEISTQIEIPRSIARIALHNETKHTEQARNQASNDTVDIDDKDNKEVRQRTPLQSGKEAAGLPTP